MNGYIAIDINSEKIGIKFGMPANEWFTQKLYEDQSLVNAETGSTSSIGVAYLIYYGYKNNCLIKDEQPKYTPGFFINWVDEISIDEEQAHVLTEIGECYAASKFTKAWEKRISEATEEIKKKMRTGNILSPSATGS